MNQRAPLCKIDLWMNHLEPNMDDFNWDCLDTDTEDFSANYSNKNRVKSWTKYIDKLHLGLTKRYTANIRSNCAYLFGMMAKFDLQKKKTSGSLERILRLISSDDDEVVSAGLNALMHYGSNDQICVKITDLILSDEKFSTLGFKIIEKQQSKLVAKLLNIALRKDSLIENWMEEI